MEQRNIKKSKRSKTKIIPPKKKRPESLSRDEVRSINKKRIKRKRKAERLALLTSLALVVLSIGVVLVLVLFFKTETITIKGDKVYADKEIILVSGVKKGDSLILVSEKKLNETLSKNLPYIGEVEVEKKLPDKLIINITATREVVAFQGSSGFILVDANGKVLDKNASMLRDNVAFVSGIAPKTITDGEKIKLSDHKTTQSFLNLISAIKESNSELITGISQDKKGNWLLIYDDRITIKITDSDDILTDLERAERIVKRENEKNPYAVGEIDLTVIDGTFYFKPAKETTEPQTDDVSKKDQSATEGKTEKAE